jgi:amino acid transporter
VVGAVIALGIFIVGGAVLRQTGGDVGLALLVWLAAGILSLLGVADPEAGGLYVYLRTAFRPLPAFLYG